jgi:hypothetical protein
MAALLSLSSLFSQRWVLPRRTSRDDLNHNFWRTTSESEQAVIAIA